MRKMLGGGMRQAGIALEKMVDRLREDHANAHLLAEGLAKIDLREGTWSAWLHIEA